MTSRTSETTFPTSFSEIEEYKKRQFIDHIERQNAVFAKGRNMDPLHFRIVITLLNIFRKNIVTMINILN